MNSNDKKYLQETSIFRIGEVYSVKGRTVQIKVDKDKNLSHLIYQGTIIKNISVGGYLKILKGFETIVCQVESEFLDKTNNFDQEYHNKADEFERFLDVKLLGFFVGKSYRKGVKEMPLIGNQCLLMDNAEFALIHNFARSGEPTIQLGHLLNDDAVPISLGINTLFSSHIGIFGNTGSGKSYTLANLYKKLFDEVSGNGKFKETAKFLLYDFNGEYSKEGVITELKTVYKISTKDEYGKDKIPLKEEDLLNPELLYILANATEKTQQPFIKRTLSLYKRVADKPHNYIRGIIKKITYAVLCMSDYVKSKQLLDYLEIILPQDKDENEIEKGLQYDLQWHSKSECYFITKDHFFNDINGREHIKETAIYQAADKYEEPTNFLEKIINYLYIQLIQDILNNKAVNEHIHPVINKLKATAKDFEKVFEINDSKDFWNNNFLTVVDLNNANISVKKLVPLLLSSKLYNEHKNDRSGELTKYLNIIVDEAHNVLSYESQRESESWKDFRLETFEEIIKEGRKFGVFVTIASQRPSDISPTIVSQLHNYFIHRLINNEDLKMIEKAVSYLDRLSFETLPILPVGACVLSGLVADLPVIVQVDRLDERVQPQSETLSLTENWFDNPLNLENC